MATPAIDWQSIYPLLEPILREAQPSGFRWPRTNGDGWIAPIHSPLREDRNPSVAVRPDSVTDPGAWTDYATGNKGSIADLARRLGVDPRVSVRAEPQPPAPTLDGFCRQRRLDRKSLEDVWGVREVTHGGRPALQYPTPIGRDRIKFLDGRKLEGLHRLKAVDSKGD
jgi:hypothetical protein